jgi:hypothetical protein
VSNLPPNPIPFANLFVPAPSGVGTDPSATPAAGSWMAILLQLAAQVQLPTTAWQPGGPEREILSLMAVAFSGGLDANSSIMAQGAFLDYSAQGSVTVTAPNGQTVTQFVTPDPTIPTQWPSAWVGVWQPGWLDELASSRYNVTRNQATAASNVLALANTTATTYGTYASGTYHVANPLNSAAYHNTNALSIPSSQIAGTGGVIVGAAGSSPLTITTQSAHGITIGQVVYLPSVPGMTLASAFAFVTAVTSTTFTASVATTGSYTSGGTVYLCTTANFTADTPGSAGNSAPGGITVTVTQNQGVFCDNLLSFAGVDFEGNVSLAARCRLKLQSLSPSGPAGAYDYFARTASQLLAAQTPPVLLDGGAITKSITVANPQTGVVTCTIANDNPISTTLGQNTVDGVSNLLVTGATNATPIVITVGSTAGLANNDYVTVSGVLGNTAANGTRQIAGLTGTTFQLVGSVGSGAYTSGGVIEGGDVGQVDRIIQANAVPDATIAITQSATAEPLSIAFTVVVPTAQAGAYLTNVTAATLAWINDPTRMPIGGLVLPGGSPPGVASYSVLEGIISQGIYPVTTLTLNGATTDYTFSLPTGVAVLAAFTPTIVRV